MIVDTHLHISEYSPDSHLPVREAVMRAREMKLDGLCITDHDTLGVMQEIDILRRELAFPLFVGVEILTKRGDFVIFGLDAVPNVMLTPEELIELTNSKGGVAIAAHPFRDNGRGIGELISTLPGLGGVECFNGSTKPLANLHALELARKRGLPCLGAGDAHWPQRVGFFATCFEHPLRDEQDLIRAVRCNECRPMAWNGTEFTDAVQWVRKLAARSE